MDRVWLKGIIKNEDGRIRKVKYTMDGRWAETSFNYRMYRMDCSKGHKSKQAAVLFTEDDAMLTVWICECGEWKELSSLASGDYNVWKSSYYKHD